MVSHFLHEKRRWESDFKISSKILYINTQEEKINTHIRIQKRELFCLHILQLNDLKMAKTRKYNSSATFCEKERVGDREQYTPAGDYESVG